MSIIGDIFGTDRIPSEPQGWTYGYAEPTEWTTDPTRPGWYWHYHHGYLGIDKLVIMDRPWKARGLKKGDLVMTGDQGEYRIADVGGYWLGPIIPPEPPK